MKDNSKAKYDSKRWPRILRRVNVSIRRIQRREVLTFLVFVAISTFFWIVQSAREETSSDYTVRLVIDDQPQDAVFTTRVPTLLRVSLTDTNFNLFRSGYGRKMDELHVNFERYADAMGTFRITAAELQSLLTAELLSSTHIRSVTPALVDARFAQTEGRKFPVRITGVALPAPNRRQHEAIISPDSVMIHAPSSVLDTMRYVYASGGNLYDLTDTLVQQLELELPIGVKATPNVVQRTIPVTQYVEKVFEQVPIQVTDTLPGTRLVVFPYSVRVSCLIDFSAYRQITADKFCVTVSQADIATLRGQEAERHGYLPIHVSYLGEEGEADHIQVSPQQAEYILER